MDKQVIISVKTVLYLFLILLGLYVLYRLGPVFAILLISTLIVFAVEPLVKWFSSKILFNKPVTRSLAVIVSYILLVLVLSGILTTGLPPVINQTKRMILTLSSFFAQFNLSDVTGSYLTDIFSQLTKVSGGVVSITLSVFSNLASIVTVIIISIYMSLDWPNIKERIFSLFPNKNKDEVKDTFQEVEVNLGHWVKGQLLLMLVIGFASFLGLLILDVDYPLALGIISGLLEIVPILGPIISAVLAAIVGFSQSPVKGVGVLVLFTIIQQLENNILVPKIMQKVSGFSPLIILLALLIGSEFFGVLGAILAVPMTMVGGLLLKKTLNSR